MPDHLLEPVLEFGDWRLATHLENLKIKETTPFVSSLASYHFQAFVYMAQLNKLLFGGEGWGSRRAFKS